MLNPITEDEVNLVEAEAREQGNYYSEPPRFEDIEKGLESDEPKSATLYIRSKLTNISEQPKYSQLLRAVTFLPPLQHKKNWIYWAKFFAKVFFLILSVNVVIFLIWCFLVPMVVETNLKDCSISEILNQSNENNKIVIKSSEIIYDDVPNVDDASNEKETSSVFTYYIHVFSDTLGNMFGYSDGDDSDSFDDASFVNRVFYFRDNFY